VGAVFAFGGVRQPLAEPTVLICGAVAVVSP
jgi:hypothetical protein